MATACSQSVSHCIECTANFSFLSGAEKLTTFAYEGLRNYSVVASEVVGRVAAAVLLSPCAALDIATHTILLLPTSLYAAGKSICQGESDFTLPWQHVQRICNAVTPLFFGSLFGVLHPFAGIVMCEPTDKHIAFGMLSSNTNAVLKTYCSPVHSLSILEKLAKCHRYAEKDGVKREIFSPEHVKMFTEAKELEESLEALQAQEYIHKITNITLFVMAEIKIGLSKSSLPELSKEVLVRLSGLLIPVLTSVDIAVTLLAQGFFLATGIVQSLSGRGPIYTEVTTKPSMHIAFLVQNILKAVGNMAGMLVWFVSPMTGFQVSLWPASTFFKMQLGQLVKGLKAQMDSAKENDRFMIPIVFGEGKCSALSVPTHDMHKTYLVIEKKNSLFNLAWVNRPTVAIAEGLDAEKTAARIGCMLAERFPFMSIEKMMKYPVIGEKPEFPEASSVAQISPQGNSTNCVVSNFFGALEVIDRVKKEDQETTELRYETVRKYLMNAYSFYKDDFFPFTDYSFSSTWKSIKAHPAAEI